MSTYVNVGGKKGSCANGVILKKCRDEIQNHGLHEIFQCILRGKDTF